MAGTPARIVLQSLMRTGQEARFVGGCVRDALIEVEAEDVDIATPLQPDEVMRRLKADGVRVVPTGIKHGTVTAICESTAFEITTLRKDILSYGRHAKVEYTDDWMEDAQRRDFTFNAMSLSPEGELYDPFDGLADLSAGRVVFVGAPRDRIREDVLRILRYFRFHARFGKGDPDPEAIAACAEGAKQLPTLSGERVREEILRLLPSDRAVQVWRLMLERGIMTHLLPWATDTDRLAALDRLEWMVGEVDILARLAALLPPGDAAAREVADRLRLSNVQRERLLALADPPLDIHADLPQVERRAALQKLGPEIYRDLLMLNAATNRVPSVEILEPLAEAAAWRHIPFPIKGQDALDRGVPPGPDVGRLVGEVESWWAAKDFRPDRDACLAELERRIGIVR